MGKMQEIVPKKHVIFFLWRTILFAQPKSSLVTFIAFFRENRQIVSFMVSCISVVFYFLCFYNFFDGYFPRGHNVRDLLVLSFRVRMWLFLLLFENLYDQLYRLFIKYGWSVILFMAAWFIECSLMLFRFKGSFILFNSVVQYYLLFIGPVD